MCRPAPRILIPVLVFAAGSLARAEIPLPDATLFGTVESTDGGFVASGRLVAVVDRGDRGVLEVRAEFVDDREVPFYVVRIPMETEVGAPGPSGRAAHRGDGLRSLVLDGQALELDPAPPPLVPGAVFRVDARTELGGDTVPQFFRGDCNGDLDYNMSDSVSVLFFLFQGGTAPPCLRACDTNDDENIDLSDAVFVLSHLFLGGPPPPAPFGSCGPDTSGDEAPSCDVRVCPPAV